jgi:hypothetical protein
VTGGTPLLMLANGTAVAASRTFERGRIIAVGASRMFGGDVMGSTAVEPTPRMRAVYQAQYDLFERVAGVRATSRYTGGAGGAALPARVTTPVPSAVPAPGVTAPAPAAVAPARAGSPGDAAN